MPKIKFGSGKTLVATLAAFLTAALLLLWAAEVAPAEAQSGSVEMTVTGEIAARLHSNGQIEFAFQPRNGERILPEKRFFPAAQEAIGWRWSTPVVLSGINIGRIEARRLANLKTEFTFVPHGGERIFPEPLRYFRNRASSWALNRVDRWLRSSEITFSVVVPNESVDDRGIVTRAEQKNAIVAKLFRLDLNHVDARTNHDLNDWGCPFTGPTYGGNAGCGATSLYGDNNVDPPPPSWTAYEGGHSGWDVSHRTDRDAPFFSLTNGTVIAAGHGWRCHDIAVFDGTNTIVYLHASHIDVNDGDRVFAGETRLGLQGDACSEPDEDEPPNDHLHIEVIPGKAQIRSGETLRIYARGAGLKPGSLKPCGEISADPLPYLYWWVAGGGAPRPNVQVASCISAPTNGQRISHDDLIRGRSSPEVYVVKIENGKQFKRHVVAHGLYAAVSEWDEQDVQTVSAASVNAIRESPLVRLPAAATRIHGGDANRIYFVEETGEDAIVLRHIPDPAAFERAGCDWDGVFAMSMGEYSYWREHVGDALNGGQTSRTFRCPQ